MQNQKNPNNLNHQFIRKPKRKQSPKHKNQNLYQFKCIHNKNPNPDPKEECTHIPYKQEYKQIKNRQSKNNTDFVMDLKYQLSFLKDQMAKIVTAKVQSAQIDNGTSKLKKLDDYFSSKTQQNEKSASTDIKKLKSKERLKFSKIKKQDFSPISPKNSSNTEESSKLENTEQISLANENDVKKRIISGHGDNLQEQIKKIGQRHKKQLDSKLNSLMEQQNLNRNIPKIVQPNDQKSSLHKQSKANSAAYEVRIMKLKKLIKQQDSEIQTLKSVIQQKDSEIIKLRIQLEQSNEQMSQTNHRYQDKQMQNTSLTKKISELIYANNQIQQKYIKDKQETANFKQADLKLRQDLGITQRKLKNIQLEVIRLEKSFKNLETEKQEMHNLHIFKVQSLNQQVNSRQAYYQEDINRLTKMIEDLRESQKVRIQSDFQTKAKQKQQQFEAGRQRQIQKQKKRQEQRPGQKQKLKQGQNLSLKQSKKDKQTDTYNNLHLKLPKQDRSYNSYSPVSSPRGSPILPLRQKQLLNVIKMHQKSIMNYQKDILFLQSECKALHYLKQTCKRQDALIKQVNENIMNEQLMALNVKYLKRKFASNNLFK